MGKLFDVSLVFSSIPELLTKLPITLELAVVSMLIGLGLGLVMAIIKMKKIRVLTQITNLLISLLRGTPVIVQLYVAFFGIPMMFKTINQQFGTNLAVANISGFVYAMIALGLNHHALCGGGIQRRAGALWLRLSVRPCSPLTRARSKQHMHLA